MIKECKDLDLNHVSAYDAMLEAAKHGIIEFIDAMRKANSDLLCVIDKNGRSIFSYAILNRKIKVFNLMHDASLNERTEIIRNRVDAFGNSLLHLAGKYGSSPNRYDSFGGPVLQIQREILFFMAVEKIMPQKYKETKNVNGKKPREIFTESHEELVKAGTKWTKETASSFIVVGALIATITFAAAFTVPGGNNQKSGVPLFLHRKTFNIFIITDAISLFFSSTLIFIFNGILMAHYTENDFLMSLPTKLLFGINALLLSAGFMMIAFVASLSMLLRGQTRALLMVVMFAAFPIFSIFPLYFQVVIENFKSTILSIFLR